MNANTIDWTLCLAWSIGHALLTGLIGHTPVNAPGLTYDAILCYLGRGNVDTHRWVGRCKACNKAHRVDGFLARGRIGGHDEIVIVAGTRCYRAADQGSNGSAVVVQCCATVDGRQRIEQRVKLQRVYDSHKPNRPRHECNAKCLGSTGPACECKCGGKNHGSSAVFV